MTATTVSQAVATRQAGPVSVMWGKRKHFAAVLPASVDVEAFLGTAAGALHADPDLMKAASAHPDSLIVTLMKCAALGHMPGTDEFYLHIRKGKVTGTEGYRGVIERMYRSGAVAKVVVREVCAADPFSYVEGVDDKPVHEIGGRGGTGASFFGADGSRNRGAMVGVYAYAQLTTGAISRVVIMDRDDVMAARESSDAKDSSYSPWNRLDGGAAHPELTGRSMWWKTAAKRLEPWVPTSAEYRREQLRASAAAAASAGTVYSVPPAPVTHAETDFTYLPPPPASVPDGEIVEAEIVDDPPPSNGRAKQEAPKPAARTARRKTAAAGDDTRSRSRSADGAQDGAAGDSTAQDATPRAAGAAPSRGAQPLPPLPGEDEPDGPGERHGKLVGNVQGQLKRLGFAVSDDDREERVITLARLAQVAYDPDRYASTNDFEEDDLAAAARELGRCKNRDALDALLGEGAEGG